MAIHAEYLHRDDVWRRLRSALGRARVRATLFVHPFGAIRTGIDIRDRLAELARSGHEIGQHTHYYSRFDEAEDGLHKETSLEPSHVRACLDRDFDYLAERIAPPEGFVSGTWTWHPQVRAWLAERRFRYDATLRTYARPEGPFAANARAAVGGRVTDLPTTAPLSAMVRGLTRAAAGGQLEDVPYDLYYVHDHDLMRAVKRWSLRAVVTGLRLRGVRHVTAGAIARIADRSGR